MLDVLHYLLDEDLAFKDGDEAKSRGIVRTSLYRHLLDKEYKYAVSDTSGSSGYEDVRGMSEDFNYGIPSNEIKPFIPTTNVNFDADNPFQGVLRESPLG